MTKKITTISIFLALALFVFAGLGCRNPFVSQGQDDVEPANQEIAPQEEIVADEKRDTDKDGLTDKEEIEIYTTDLNDIDTDNDGLTDYEEVKKYNTDPENADTDGDGFKDGKEVRAGYNPLESNPASGSEGGIDSGYEAI